jgi:hypothetical protein
MRRTLRQHVRRWCGAGLLLAGSLAGCASEEHDDHGHAGEHHEDAERGPMGGRLFRASGV